MANDIASHTRNLIQQYSETMDRLKNVQDLEVDNKHIEGAESAWMLRAYFLSKAEKQWDELGDILLKEILPLLADIKGALKNG